MNPEGLDEVNLFMLVFEFSMNKFMFVSYIFLVLISPKSEKFLYYWE